MLIDEVAKGVDAAWRLGLDNAIKQSNQSILSAALQQVPTLSEEQDREQIEGLMQLANAMRQIADKPNSDKQQSNRIGSIAEAAGALRWIVQEVQTLPAAAREEALQLPVNLFAKVTSRVVARAIRATFSATSQRRLPQAGNLR